MTRRLGSNRTHGLRATYVEGCRCGPCCEASTRYNAERHARMMETKRVSDLPQAGDMSWAAQANCQNLPTDLFFPGRGEANARYMLLRPVCAACPVRVECLESALYFESFDSAPSTGFQGGWTPQEREAELRRRTKAAGDRYRRSRRTAAREITFYRVPDR